MKIFRPLLLTIFLTTTLSSCSSAAEKGETQSTTRKGAQQGMKTYYMGRFAVDVPAEFKLALQSHRFRLIAIEEFPGVHDADQKWREHLDKVEKMQNPQGINKIIIKDQEIGGMGKWARGVLYYSDYMADDECNWDILVSYGDSAALFSLKGLLDKQQSMLAWLQEVCRAYRPDLGQRQLKSGLFHTEYGVIELPYKRQENTYARFEGPLGMILKVEMEEIHKDPEREGIIDRTVAALAIGAAGGLELKKIRSNKRIAAELSGEEEIMQGDDGRQKNVSFDWEYLGTVESGEKPMIQINVDTTTDNLEKKMQVWDKILSSLRLAYH